MPSLGLDFNAHQHVKQTAFIKQFPLSLLPGFVQVNTAKWERIMFLHGLIR